MAIAPADLFSANQIIHLRPIAGGYVFDRFVKANTFVRDFYPNFELDDRSAFAPSELRRGRLLSAAERVLSFGPARERLTRWSVSTRIRIAR